MFKGRKLKQLQIEKQTKILELEIQGLEEIEELTAASTSPAVKVQKESDEDDWMLLGDDNTKRSLTEDDQDKLKSQVTESYYKTAHGRNIIRLFEKYVAGRGFDITPESGIPEVATVWKEFWKRERLELKKKEIVRRSLRDGDCFIRYFTNNLGQTMIRFMISQKVANPTEKKGIDKKSTITSGIETDINDIETVLAYWYKGSRIPASEVDHIKILVDSDVKRGRSYLEPIIADLFMYKDWKKDRMKLNKIRNTVALIKKVKGTSVQAENIKDNQETIRNTYPNGTSKQKAPAGVSVITTNQGVEYDLKSPNLQASDVQHDGRMLLLNIAAGAGLPEFMVTSDASNGNYSSLMTAEGPAVMEFEDWQDFFAIFYKSMFERVIKNAIAKNIIPSHEIITTEEKKKDKDGNITTIEKKETIPTSVECNITFPDIVSRNILEETKAIIMHLNSDLCSKRTAQSRLDYDPDAEAQQIKKEEDSEDEDEDDGKPTEEETDKVEEPKEEEPKEEDPKA